MIEDVSPLGIMGLPPQKQPVLSDALPADGCGTPAGERCPGCGDGFIEVCQRRAGTRRQCVSSRRTHDLSRSGAPDRLSMHAECYADHMSPFLLLEMDVVGRAFTGFVARHDDRDGATGGLGGEEYVHVEAEGLDRQRLVGLDDGGLQW